MQMYQCSFTNVISAAKGSAAGLVNILARDFPSFRDEFPFQGRRKPVRFLKRAQILVADLWACFQGEGYGAFKDIDKITMFADYRLPQILSSLGCIYYSPKLDMAVRQKQTLESGGNWEMQLRGRRPLNLIGNEADTGHSLQYLVRRTNTQRNSAGTPRCEGECHFDRLLLV
jgi:hypothetical protein